jgi:hypothetical protein
VSTFAASIHLKTVDRAALERLLKQFESDDLKFTTVTEGGWSSVHAEDMLFVAEADTFAQKLSKSLGTLAVSFSQYDRDNVTCATFAKGLAGESLVIQRGKRTTLVAEKWKRAGLGPEALQRLQRPTTNASEAALLVASALRIPTRTVLVDDPALLEADKPVKLPPAVVSEWAQLERDGKRAGVEVPSLTEFVQMLRDEGTEPDADDVRGTIHLLREKFVPKKK